MGWKDVGKKVWNAFKNEEENGPPTNAVSLGQFGMNRGSRFSTITGDARTIITTIKNRIAVDVANVEFRHAKLDDEERYLNDVPSSLNHCLKIEANIDQPAQDFRIDMALTLMEEGVIAIFPSETSDEPFGSDAYDIESLRVGTVVGWQPRHVTVRVYDDRPGEGEYKDVTVPKRFVAIVQNPFYKVMNDPNSTLQRLVQKLAMLDTVDAYASSGKLDLIIQLPYVIKTESKREQANTRRKDLEVQMKDSQLGIGYIDGTERITQLNRPVENSLPKQIEDLTKQLYSQLGLPPSVFDGTADDATMLNYQNRTIKPIVKALAESMKRSFLSKTAISQGQSIEYFIDPFELVPIADIAEIADKFTRNEILSANEIRQIVGRKPSSDPKADELRNSNMPAPEDSGLTDMGELPDDGTDPEDSALGEIDAEISALLAELESPDGS